MDTRFRKGDLSNSCALVHIPSIPVADLVATPGLAPFAMVQILMARFPAADTTAIERTARRLQVDAGPGAIRAAVMLEGPDAAPVT